MKDALHNYNNPFLFIIYIPHLIYEPAGFTSGYFNKYPTLTTIYSVGLIASYHRLAFLIDTVLVGEVHGFILSLFVFRLLFLW